MTVIKEVLKKSAEELKRAGINTANLDSRILLENIMNISTEELIKNSDRKLSESEVLRFDKAVERRKNLEPLSKIIGEKEFWSIIFKTNEYTLDPRPDSETLIEAVLEQYKDKTQSLRILDLGTGTGCLILSLLSEYPHASGVGGDISEGALKVAQENAEKLGFQNRVEFIKSDWAENITKKFDIIISNPPYIKSNDIKTLEKEVAEFDPISALDGGKSGLAEYTKISSQLNLLLNTDGRVFFEIGEGQESEVEDIINLHVIAKNKDLAGITRCLIFKA